MSNTRKMTEPLDLDVLLAEAKHEPFTFTLGGKQRSLPHVKTLELPQLRALDRGDYESVLPEIGADEDTVTAVLKLPAFAFDPLIERWLGHSGIDVGELRASSRS